MRSNHSAIWTVVETQIHPDPSKPNYGKTQFKYLHGLITNANIKVTKKYPSVLKMLTLNFKGLKLKLKAKTPNFTKTQPNLSGKLGYGFLCVFLQKYQFL